MYIISAACLLLSVVYLRKQKVKSAKDIVIFCVIIGICISLAVIYSQTEYNYGLVSFLTDKF